MRISDWSSDVCSSDLVHDAFDLVKETAAGPIRMIGAGTLSQRIRSTPPSFNDLTVEGAAIDVRVRNLDHVPTPDMQIDGVPADALPPSEPGEPMAPVAAVPPVDRSEEHTSELQSLMRISYAVFCLKKKK